ncbi:MAG: filamentous hemagglutinin N-terminal domain-containing protein, partial [Betaproteobacteria bacterium]
MNPTRFAICTDDSTENHGLETVSRPSLFKRIVIWITVSAFVLQPIAASAQVISASTGNYRPQVIAAPNGVPVVQINAPSGAGVSRNQYYQYSPTSQGVVLNNSKVVVQTQLAGFIDGNANLAGGVARIILNEVTSNLPSNLRGFTEVAGSKAEVIIVNPNGITCNGCGFINTSRGVLTTGTPVFATDGSLDAFRVIGGTIAIEGAGLNGSNTIQIDLIARAVKINAEFWGQNINVIAGANQVAYTDLATQTIVGTGTAPAVAIDVSELGGMYANKIQLVGTEAGVGVVNSGTIAAQAGDLSIDSAGRITLIGTTQSSGRIDLTAQQDISNSGTTYAQDNIQLTSQAGISNSGKLVAKGNLTLTAASLDSSGLLAAGMASDGKISGNGALSVTTSGDLKATGNNTAAGNIQLSGSKLDLSGSKTWAGADVALTAGTGGIDHRAAKLSAGGSATVVSKGKVDNRDGLIEANGTLTLTATSIDNTSGRIVNVGTGLTKINGGASIVNSNVDKIDNRGVIGGNGDVEISASQITNAENGMIKVANKLSLNADYLDNSATGEVSASTTQLTIGDTLTNRGLIDGIDTRINAATLNNIGTGRIYGDTLSIAAGTINNINEKVGDVTKAATIAARRRLDIGAKTLNNREHSLIYSEGGMAFGGELDKNRQALGSATTLNNASATIESIGDMRIDALQINNTNEHFAYELRETSAQGGVREDVNSSYYRIFTRTIYDPIATASDPANIRAGRNMTLNSTNIRNHASHIVAGGTTTILGSSITHTDVQAQRIIKDVGTAYNSVHVDQTGNCGYIKWNCKPAHEEWQASPYQNTASNTVNVSQITPPKASGATLVSATAGGVEAVRSTPVNVSLPSSSLFKISPDPTRAYLIERDLRFTDYGQFMSSDYMLSRLKFDPQQIQKRLGDGFYEQRLIYEQIVQLTGHRYLADFTSDDAQYLALMNAGIAYAIAYNIRPGVALTAAQMALQTTDLVWLVEREVTLPDGLTQKVLVPQVYAMVREGDLEGSGALLSGKNINLNLSGDLISSGTIAGRQAVNISADNLSNLGGRIQGDALMLSAKTDFNNIGGSIEAQSNLQAIAGRDLNVLTTTSSTINSVGSNTFSRTGIDQVASLTVTGDKGVLVASAGRDANFTAALVSNSATNGQTVLAAGNDLKLGTVVTAERSALVRDADNYLKDSRSIEVGSQVDVSGKLSLYAGNDLIARAATVQAGAALSAEAGRDVNVTSGQSTQSVDIAQKRTSSGLFSSTTTTTRDSSVSTGSVGSSLSGDTVSVVAGRNIAVIGSDVVSTQGTQLNAKNNITIAAATNTSSESHFKDEQQSGFFSSGSFGFTLGSKQQSTDQQADATRAAKSTVGSVQGDVSLLAGKNYQQVGSDVLTPQGNIAIAAQKVDIVEARETSHSTFETKSQQSGLTIAITSPIITAIQTAIQMKEAAADTKNSRMKLLAAANTGMAANNAVDAVKAGQGTTINGKEGQIATGKTQADGTPVTRDATAGDQVGGV